MTKGSIFRLVVFLPLTVALSCSSVATKHSFYGPITTDLKARKYSDAVVKVETARADNKYSKKDRLLYYMDAGMAHHYALGYDSSNEQLTLAEDAAEELFTKSVSRAAASLLLNDNILEYAGEDYEILYTNLIKALNYLALDEFDEAFVEIRRANEKLDLLEQKYAKAAERYSQTPKDDTSNVSSHINYDVEKVRFNNDAFARYLSMHMYAAEGKTDDAQIDYDDLGSAFRSQPHIYNFSQPDVKYQPLSEDKTILSVVALAGLSPTKEALNLRIRTDKDLQLVQVLYTDGAKKDAEYSHIYFPVKADYYFKFSIPILVPRHSRVSRIRVKCGTDHIGDLQLIEDVSKVAEEIFKAKKSLIYLRSVARAIVKGLAAHKVKVKLDEKTGGGLGGWLAKAAVDIGTDAIENADLRCSQLLPGKIFVGDFEIAPGTYDLTVDFFSSDGVLICSNDIPGFQVKNNKFNLVEVVNLN